MQAPELRKDSLRMSMDTVTGHSIVRAKVINVHRFLYVLERRLLHLQLASCPPELPPPEVLTVLGYRIIVVLLHRLHFLIVQRLVPQALMTKPAITRKLNGTGKLR